MHIQNLVKNLPIRFKILCANKNLTSIKGHNYVSKMTGNNLNLVEEILSISMHIQNLVKFYQLVLKILSGNEILTSCEQLCVTIPIEILSISMDIHNLVKFSQFVLNAYTKFGKILSTCSQDIERKLN